MRASGRSELMSSLQAIEVLNAIYERRAIRRYRAEPIRRESLQELIDAAIQAPSAMNEQPWAFVVIAGEARLETYSQRAKQYLLELNDGSLNTHGLGPDVDIFHGAPALVVICATSSSGQHAQDCALAAQNLMLAAHASGFGTCPIGLARPWLSLAATKRELGIHTEWVPVLPIVIGVPAETPSRTSRNPAQIVWN